MSAVDFLVTTLGAAVILGIWSMVFYKESYWSRWVEASAVGLGGAYLVVTSMGSVYVRCITPILKGQYLFLVPLILGILTFIQFFPRYRWAIRWPMAVLFSVQLALTVRGTFSAYFWFQVLTQVTPFVIAVSSIDYFNAIVTLVATVTTMLYFTYSIERKGFVGAAARLGRFILMAGFGVLFTFGLLTRIGWLSATLRYLLSNWLGII